MGGAQTVSLSDYVIPLVTGKGRCSGNRCRALNGNGARVGVGGISWENCGTCRRGSWEMFRRSPSVLRYVTDLLYIYNWGLEWAPLGGQGVTWSKNEYLNQNSTQGLNQPQSTLIQSLNQNSNQGLNHLQLRAQSNLIQSLNQNSTQGLNQLHLESNQLQLRSQ